MIQALLAAKEGLMFRLKIIEAKQAMNIEIDFEDMEQGQYSIEVQDLLKKSDILLEIADQEADQEKLIAQIMAIRDSPKVSVKRRARAHLKRQRGNPRQRRAKTLRNRRKHSNSRADSQVRLDSKPSLPFFDSKSSLPSKITPKNANTTILIANLPLHLRSRHFIRVFE
ncbi:MAG: hypothetical protein GY818_16860, partial [Planctomycetaceae bacterium]|nr:hypothetical protein [Planctomycetaceae bacterium]